MPLVLAAIALLLGLGLTGCEERASDRLAAARAEQEAGEHEASIEPLRAVLAEHPAHGEANYRLGTALVQTGRLGPAVWPLRKAMESEEFSEAAGRLLISVLIDTGNAVEARNVADELLEQKPGDVEGLRLRARAQLQMRDFDGMLADAERLLELAPGDGEGGRLRAVALTELGRWEEAEAAFQAMGEEAVRAADVSVAARACLALAKVRELRADQPGAEQAFNSCAAGFATDVLVLSEVSGFQMRRGDPEKAEAVWRRATELAPDAPSLRIGLASQLAILGDLERAKQELRRAAEDLPGEQALEALAELHRRSGELEEADAVLARALAKGDSQRLRFMRADVLVDAGRLEEAEALARELEGSFADFIRGRVRLLRGDPAGALERLETGLARWPDNAPARAAAGRAAQEIGDTARAFEHYRQAIRSDARATDAALAAALLARALGRPQEAADYLSYHVTNRPYTDARTLVFAIESAQAAGNEQQAEQFLEMIEQHAERGNASAVAALAGLERRRSGAAGALRRIDAGKLDLRDPKHEPALRARLDLLLELGDAEAALAAIDRALAGHPEEPSFLDLRARVLGVLGRTDEARASFQRALAANPGHAPSLAGLGALEVEAGDLPSALSYFDRAATADSADAESAYRAAQLVLARGDAPEAERRLRALLAVTPVHAGACNDLAWILAEGGRDLDLALELARRAALLSPQPSADVADTLAFVQLTRGEAQAALSTLEAAVQDHPRSGLLRYRQGLAHARLGDPEAALEAFREALRDASFREGEAARAQIARLEAQTPPSSRP